MKKLSAIFGLLLLFNACSKDNINATSSFKGNWSGGYFAGGYVYGDWNIVVADNGSVTGTIKSAPAFPSNEYFVTGNVNTDGVIQFTALISSTIQWDFSGTLTGDTATGTWSATAGTMPGDPPNKIWSGNKK